MKSMAASLLIEPLRNSRLQQGMTRPDTEQSINYFISHFRIHAQYVPAVCLAATRPVNTADCTNEWRYFLKYSINISTIIHFKQYLPSFIKSAVFTGRAARQTNRLYVLRMTVKLAY